MSAVVIAFPGNQTSARCGGKTKKSLHGSKRRPQLKMRVDRITALLDELEEIARGLEHSALPPVIQDEGNPQPHVDREVLERFFHSLDRYQ